MFKRKAISDHLKKTFVGKISSTIFSSSCYEFASHFNVLSIISNKLCLWCYKLSLSYRILV